MTPELYQRLKPLYDAALDLEKEQRALYVSQACGDDRELRENLEALLAAGDDGPGPLDAPLVNLRDLYPVTPRTLADGQLLLGRFRIVRLLGVGGMGEVYEAEDLFLRGVNVALKTILPHVATDPGLQKRFENEVLLAREVTHPNLCPIHTIFHCDDPPPGFLFLTMKLLPGTVLAARLQQPPPIATAEAMAILRQASLGLAAIHAAGIIHRDIKSNNIMVDGTGPDCRLWITDFGLARAFENETTLSTSGAVAGTPGYVAPEMFAAFPPSEASDLFALGVVLHEVFTGQKPAPLPGTHSVAVSSRLSTSRIPALAVRLITGCLHDDPQHRCAAFAEALESIDSRLDRSRYGLSSQHFWTRRRVLIAAGACFGASVGATWWKWDGVENALHPLPSKRFVAILNWPQSSDPRIAPILNGALTAIKVELARFEASDRNLFVASPDDLGTQTPGSSQLKDICDSLGANLALAATGIPGARNFTVLLRLVDAASGLPLRQRTLDISLAAITSLPQRAVEAASALLGLHHSQSEPPSAEPGTQSSTAFIAFQAAETLVKEHNDTGLEPAIEKYKQALDVDPRFAEAYARLAAAYCRFGLVKHDPAAFDLARRNCQAALRLNPNLAAIHIAMAAVLQDTGDTAGALKEYDKGIALDPSNASAVVWQAQLYNGLNRWKDAESALRKLLDERPNNWLAYNELGYTFNGQGRYAEAIRQYQAACVAAPGFAMAHSNLGTVLAQLGRFTEAVPHLKKSFELHPNPLAASNLSGALRGLGKPQEALPFALKATELDPGDDWNWLELADCYSSLPGRQSAAKNAWGQAADAAQHLLATNPSDGPSWMRFALYKVKTGAPQNALAHIKKAETLGAGDMDSQLIKARTLESLGHRDDALDTLKACFLRGATLYQVSNAPDLRTLQKDPRYRKLLEITPAAKEVT